MESSTISLNEVRAIFAFPIVDKVIGALLPEVNRAIGESVVVSVIAAALPSVINAIGAPVDAKLTLPLILIASEPADKLTPRASEDIVRVLTLRPVPITSCA